MSAELLSDSDRVHTTGNSAHSPMRMKAAIQPKVASGVFLPEFMSYSFPAPRLTLKPLMNSRQMRPTAMNSSTETAEPRPVWSCEIVWS